MFAAHQLGEVGIALRVRSVQADLEDTQEEKHTERKTHGSRGARDLFHGDRMRQVAEACAAPALGYRDPQQSLLTEGRPQVTRKFIAPIDLVRPRRNALRCEAPYLGSALLG